MTSGRGSRADRAKDIEAAIGRFEGRMPTGDHDGRLIDENLGTEVGFGGSAASRRQQVQQYFRQFPALRRRWRTAKDDEKERVGQQIPDRVQQLTTARAETARLRLQLRALDQVADLLRRKAEERERRVRHLERRVQQLEHQLQGGAVAPTDNVVELRPAPEPPHEE
jgi:predicted RNase H-like nuclease (RuvC/YqgF family)